MDKMVKMPVGTALGRYPNTYMSFDYDNKDNMF